MSACSNEEQQSVDGYAENNISSDTIKQCVDDRYDLQFVSDSRILPYSTYVEYYGVGKSPIPNADRCNSDIGKIFEVFPDQNFAQCISEILGVSTDEQVSQHFLDSVVEFNLSNITHNKYPDSQCLKHIDDITDLTGLERFRNLRQIIMRGKKMADISSFKSMPFLTTIDIRETAVVDVSPIVGHVYLETVMIPKDNPGINSSVLGENGIGIK